VLSVTNFTCDPCVVSCHCDSTCEILIKAESKNLKFCSALAAPVELLSCVRAAVFCISAQFNSGGGDALTLSKVNNAITIVIVEFWIKPSDI
jgi:hypothetical protein